MMRCLHFSTRFVLFGGLILLSLSSNALGASCIGQEKNPANSTKYTSSSCEQTKPSQCQDPYSVAVAHTEFTCPGGLSCYICECAQGKIIDGVCEANNSLLTPKTTTSLEVAEKEIKNATGNLNTPSNTNTTANSSSNETCPIKLQDSKGNCCKKRYYDLELKATVCCEGILLNTNVPFIGQCIVYSKNSGPQPIAGLILDENTAFPRLMGGLTKILLSVILLAGFMGILVGGVMISASGAKEDGATTGKKLIGNVMTALALLGASGVILRLINPNFFG